MQHELSVVKDSMASNTVLEPLPVGALKPVESKDRGAIIIWLFFCSGATALVYEVVWSKFLAQMFGSTIYAQTVVLAAFMGGLALGNRLCGGWADRLRQPVRVYGYLEIGIGVYAFFFPTFDRIADRLFVGIGAGIVERTGLLLALKGALSAALLLGPTMLMGGTLPLLAAWLQKSSWDAGRQSARCYSVNSLGAVTGSLLAGFWLVQNLGMVSSLQMTALVNLVIGGIAIVLSRGGQLGRSHPAEVVPIADSGAAFPGTWRWAGVIVAVTGAVSMGLEVLASRSLALIFGSSLQSFAIVLAAFILGIGLGSAWMASARRRQRSGERMISLLLCVAAGWVALLVFNLEGWVDFYRIARSGLGRSSVGYVYHQLLAGGISIVILGFPAACIGAVLPLMMRAVSRSGAPLGTQVGALLTWNTLGAVVGTLGTGFVLMPWAGLRNAFGVLALALAMVALIAAWRSRWRGGMASAVAVCALIGCLFVFGGESWRHVMSSGVFRAREVEFDSTMLPQRKQHIQILSYEDAADATVTVEQGDGAGAAADRGLRVNGKPDASALGDLSTELLVAHLPMLARAGAKDVFVLGLGARISAGALRSYPFERIVVAENCEPVIRAAKFFEAWNRRVLSDPRTHLWHEDARTVLKLRPQLYDVIITQPSNPWTVGVGSVFSLEYYELAASRLKPGGITAQWFHVYEMHDGIVELVLRTFSSVFPYVEIWDTLGGDIVMLGSRQPWRTGPDIFRQGLAIDGVRADLAQIGIRSAEALLARQLASQRTGFAIAGSGPIQSDLFPLLEYAAPRAFYIGVNARILERFDERTRQQLLASAENRAILRGLTADDVQAAFGTFASVNVELRDYVRRAALGMKAPCAFTTNSALPAMPLSPVNSPANAATLNRAATLFGGQAEHRLEAVGLVESALRATRPPVNWPAAEWADLAAATAFDLGDWKRAEQLAALALELEPANAQASYMARVLERERQQRPAAPR